MEQDEDMLQYLQAVQGAAGRDASFSSDQLEIQIQ